MHASKLLAAAVAALGLAACGPKVASIDIKPESATLKSKGATQKLAATPKDGEGKAVEGVALSFVSSDPAVATVDAQGTVTAVKSGDATIKASFEGKVAKEAKLVVSIPATISVAPAEVKLEGVGKKMAVTAKVLDEKGRETGTEVAWENTNGFLSVGNGEVTAQGAGSGQIFAVAAGIKAPVAVTVTIPAVAAVHVEKKLDVKAGKAARLQPVAKDDKGAAIEGSTFTYASADAKVAKVEADGTVHGVKKGKTKVTVTSGGKSATVEVVVAK